MIVQIPYIQRAATLPGARLDARRHFAGIQPMRAQVACFRDTVGPFGELFIRPFFGFLHIEITRIVWAGDHAVPAADASVVIHNYDAVVAFIGSLDRADLRARGIVAVIAQQYYGFPGLQLRDRNRNLREY